MTIRTPSDISPGGPQVSDQPWSAVGDKETTVSERWPGRGWQPVEANSGPADPVTGEAAGGFEDGPGPWRQT